MKSFFASLPLLAATVSAHTTFQSLIVDGKAQGSMATSNIRHNWQDAQSNYPVKDVTSNDVICNKFGATPAASKVTVQAGATLSQQWHHEPSQRAGDADEPIASSHKGPVMVYLGKVDDSATASPEGVKWIKIYEDGLDSSGKWGVDRFIANKGLFSFKIPECVENGDYFLRGEIIALHEADRAGGAQLYMECAQITVTGGTGGISGDAVAFPGAYSATDPGISYNMYASSPSPPYTIPGPKVATCGAGGSSPAPAPSSSKPAPAPSSSATAAPTVAPTTTKSAVPTTATSKPATSSAAAPSSYQAPTSYGPPKPAPTTLKTTTASVKPVTTPSQPTAAPTSSAPAGGAYNPSNQEIEDFFTKLMALYDQWKAGN